jgi:menaquinone-dependent protoporphyrinogen oxidase
MKVLVAYATRHGATAGIAERIAATLQSEGLVAEARPAASVRTLASYDAFVVGSAAYMFHWLGDATKLVRSHRAELAAKPSWFFSSGPLGTEPLNEKGQDQKEAAIPKEVPELVAAVNARGHAVFFGAYDPAAKPIGIAERAMKLMPAARDSLPAGDFRDWAEVEDWARSIAADLRSGAG